MFLEIWWYPWAVRQAALAFAGAELEDQLLQLRRAWRSLQTWRTPWRENVETLNCGEGLTDRAIGLAIIGELLMLENVEKIVLQTADSRKQDRGVLASCFGRAESRAIIASLHARGAAAA